MTELSVGGDAFSSLFAPGKVVVVVVGNLGRTE